MEKSVKNILNGESSFIDFNKVIVEKCTYINNEEEKTEVLPIWDLSTSSLIRSGNYFQLTIIDNLCNVRVPFAEFNVLSQFTYKQETWGEIALVNGNKIQMSGPLFTPSMIDNDCKITYFSISRQHEKLIVFILLTPNSNDDYYYRVRFEEE